MAAKSWDTKVPFSTSWRPDIYVVVKTNNDDGNWVTAKKTKVHSNQKLANDLTTDLHIRVPDPRARTVWGYIRDQNDKPIEGARVRAWDADWPDGDDFMGESMTNKKGLYSITYTGKKWDTSLPWSDGFRPDIYVSAAIKNACGDWVEMKRSQTRADQIMMEGCRVDLSVSIHGNPRTVWGFITDENGSPVRGATVWAWDYDWGIRFAGAKGRKNGFSVSFEGYRHDDEMGHTHTDEKGFYRICYRSREWDAGSPGSWVRPDVFIQATSDTHYGQSSVHQDVRDVDGVRIDLRLKPRSSEDSASSDG